MKTFVLLAIILLSTAMVFAACDNSGLGEHDETPTSRQVDHRAAVQQSLALQSSGKTADDGLTLSRFAASPAFTHEGEYDTQGNGSFTLTLSQEQPPNAAQSVRWQEAASMLPTSISWDMTSMTFTLPGSTGSFDDIGPGSEETTETIKFHEQKELFDRLLEHRLALEEQSIVIFTPPLSVADFQAAGFEVTVLDPQRLEVTRTEATTGLVTKHRYNIQQQRFEYSETFLHGERLMEFYPPPM